MITMFAVLGSKYNDFYLSQRHSGVMEVLSLLNEFQDGNAAYLFTSFELILEILKRVCSIMLAFCSITSIIALCYMPG